MLAVMLSTARCSSAAACASSASRRRLQRAVCTAEIRTFPASVLGPVDMPP